MLLAMQGTPFPPLASTVPHPSSIRRLISAVEQTLLGVLIRPTNPNYFSQKIGIFNNDEQSRLVLVWYRSGPKMSQHGRSARLQLVLLQIQRQSAALFGFHGNNQITGLLPRFVSDRVPLEDWVGESPVGEVLCFCFGALHGRSLLHT